MTLPTLQVLLDDGTGTFPYDITLWVLFANGYSLSRGREDWQAAVTAGSLSGLTLNNSDGRFSPGSTLIASPSPIKVDQRIRVKETVNGVTFIRFTGYVKSWPVGWPAVVSTFSTVTVTATDAQARAERRVLRSVIEEEAAETGVLAGLYTLGEPAGATSAGDVSGNQSPELTAFGSGTAVVFGTATGPETDGLTAAQFGDGQYLLANLATAPSALALWFSTTTNDASSRYILGGSAVYVRAGNLETLAGHTALGAVSDGLEHLLLINGSDVYLDNVLVESGTAPISGFTRFGIGGPFSTTGAVSGFIGSIGQLQFFSSTLTAPQRTALYAAGKSASLIESGTARITRLAGYANLPVGTLDTSLTNVPFVDFTGRSSWDTIQEVVDAEVGTTYVDGSGNLTFHNRNEVSLKTTPDLSIDKQFVTSDVLPTQDDQRILNHLETTAQSTGVTQLVNNAASETTHGRYPDSKTYLVQTDAEALDRGNWIVTNFAEPATRYGTLTIDLYRMTAAQAQAALAAVDVDAWVRVTNFPSQTPGSTTVDVVVQGFTEEVTETTWRLQCNVVSRSLFNVGIYGNATYGIYDSAVSRYYF